MRKKKVSSKSENTENIRTGDISGVSGQVAVGKKITQTQMQIETLPVSDKRELIDSLIEFQKDMAKLGLPEDEMNVVKGNVSAAIIEAKKEKPDLSKIEGGFESAVETIKGTSEVIEKVSNLESTKKILKIFGKVLGKAGLAGLSILL